MDRVGGGDGALERGGNAFDAAVTVGLILQVVEPHLNGPAGDLPVIFRPAGGEVAVISAQGPAPQAAAIDAFRRLGRQIIPGSGLLATVCRGPSTAG